MGKYDTPLWEVREQGPKDIITERADGSSDGLPEDRAIDLGNGYRECIGWNWDIQKAWPLRAVCRPMQESTAKELSDALNQAIQELFPNKSNLTAEEGKKVYDRMNEILNNWK